MYLYSGCRKYMFVAIGYPYPGCILSKVYFVLLQGNFSFSLESPVRSWHLYNTTKTYPVILSVGSDHLKRLVHTV